MPRYDRFGDFQRLDIRDGLSLFAYPTPKFKTVSIEAVLLSELGPDSSKLAVLPQTLRRGTSTLPDMQRITRFLEGMYGATLDADVVKAGEYHAMVLKISVLSPARVPEGRAIVENAVRFLADLVSDPLLAGGVFPAGVVAREKENQKNMVESLVNSREQYAWERLLTSMCSGERFSVYEYGSAGGIEAITPESLTDYWKALISNAPLAVAAAGDFDPAMLADAVDARFSWKRGKTTFPPPAEFRPPPISPASVSEEIAVRQERVLQGFRVDADAAGSEMAASMCFSGLLGGFSFSRLFKAVRENEGLAYDVGSHLERLKRVLVTWAGVKPGGSGRVKDLMARELADLAAGRISGQEMDSSRRQLIAETRSVADSPGALINSALEGWLTGRPPALADFEAEVQRLGQDDVARIASATRLDTTFTLVPSAGAEACDEEDE